MDYGTGHETAWALFMCCLSILRFFPLPVPSPDTSGTAPDYTIERALALSLFPRYIDLTWRLQDAYRLEPAGSHGVWGLDDSSFLGYYWGSAQLRGEHTPLYPPLMLKSAKIYAFSSIFDVPLLCDPALIYCAPSNIIISHPPQPDYASKERALPRAFVAALQHCGGGEGLG